ncbi:transposase [Sorangium sp. So ce381]|uniref:transposase n=1 Tax=Sorangium sp. So ce381 TaxID=3133307 RepID=UPI003F5C981A
MASACFAAEGGSGVAQRGALRRRVARGEGPAASPIGVGAWPGGAAPRDSPSFAALLSGPSMRCRLFRDRACVPALCQPNVELTCRAKRRQVQFCVGRCLVAHHGIRHPRAAPCRAESRRSPGARTGSVGFPQRFGSSLNVHVHFHAMAIDGVFEKTAMGVRFQDAPPPSKDDASEVARRVRERALLWLRRRGYLDERAAEERSNETIEPPALDACTQLALAGGAYLARPFEHKDSPDAAFERRERRFSAACDGFDVHCAVRIAADDGGRRPARERLVRYCSRPAFAFDRIELLLDGRIAYLLKTPRRVRTHRVMSPMEFMARLVALIPPPNIPLVRCHGVFAPRSSWRSLVTPKPPARAAKSERCAGHAPLPAAPAPAAPAPASPAPASPCAPPALSARSLAHAEPTVRVESILISVLHWGRLLEGELFATSRYVEWAVLMKRSFGFDALRCPKCERRMRVLSTITDSAVVRRILDHLNLPWQPRTAAPARDPTWEPMAFGFDAA